LALLQTGFDQGYNTVGVKLGLAIGDLKGKVDALAFHVMSGEVSSPKHAQIRDELVALQKEFANIKLEDLIEPGWEHIQPEVLSYASKDAVGANSSKANPPATQFGPLEELRTRYLRCWSLLGTDPLICPFLNK
jgi:hypothetical protein